MGTRKGRHNTTEEGGNAQEEERHMEQKLQGAGGEEGKREQ